MNSMHLERELRITEIFYSLQGETRTVGVPTVFIRLTGCPLRCQYCDTAYAFKGGEKITIKEILSRVAKWDPAYVTVTGGEPLAQEDVHILLTALCEQGYEVSLETSGAMTVAKVDPRVVKVIDFKTPGSGEVHRNLYENIHFIQAQDQIKFVICHREDYEWSKSLIEKLSLMQKTQILFSPSYAEQNATELAEWILEDRLKVRFQIQLHKVLWGEETGK